MTGREVRVYSDHGELMESLLKHRSKFATDEEFKNYAVTAVRRFIADLRALGIEVSLRANYLDRPPSHYSPASKLGN
jgi:hypothetical protein